MPAPHLAKGATAERRVRQWLEAQGLIFLRANFRCKTGEIDLIMLDRDCLVIVEVRYRRSTGYGGALASVSHTKRQKIIRATRYFLRCNPKLGHRPLRFDVVAVSGPVDQMKFDWRQRAFDCSA